MNLLNLDDVTSTQRTVILGGTEYEIAQPSLGEMITSIKNAKKRRMPKTPEAIAAEMLSSAKDLLPSCPDETLAKLSIKQLTALIEFSQAPDSDFDEQSDAKEGDKVEKKQPRKK